MTIITQHPILYILLFLIVILLAAFYKFYKAYYPSFNIRLQDREEPLELSHKQFEDTISMTLDMDDFLNSADVIARWYEARDNQNYSLPLSDVKYTLYRIPKNRDKSTPKVYNMIIHKINTVLYEN